MKLAGILTLPFLAVYVVVAIIAAALGLANVHWPGIDFVSSISLLLFAALCGIALISEKVYLPLLVFMMVGFSSATNNFIPGVFMGTLKDLGVSIFPFFTHLDIFLALGIARFSSRYLNKDFIDIGGHVLVVVFFMFCSFIVNVFDSKNMYEAQLVVVGGFQLRYVILIYVLLLFLKERRLELIAIGLVISLFFLLAEATLFTAINGMDRLSSGSLATNTFGNIVAQISVFLFFFSRSYSRYTPMKWLMLLSSGLGIVTSILTGTRMSVIAVVLVVIIVWLCKRLTVMHLFRLLVVGAIAAFVFLRFEVYKSLPDEYRVWEFVTPAMVSTIMSEDNASGTSIQRTEESTSIITRLQLYRTSFRMIAADPFWGIGPGRWNYEKSNFGFDLYLLIDSHNGYLALISDYGILSGLIMIGFLLVLPSLFALRRIRRVDRISDSGIWMLGLISLGMAICEVSNAGVAKPQVFAILTFVAMILFARNKEESRAGAGVVAPQVDTSKLQG